MAFWMGVSKCVEQRRKLFVRVDPRRTRQKISCQCRNAGRIAEKSALTELMKRRSASSRVENFLPMSKRVEQCRKQQNAVSGHTRLATAFFCSQTRLNKGKHLKTAQLAVSGFEKRENKNSLSRKQGRSPLFFLKDFLSIFFSIRCIGGLKNTNGAIEKTQMVRRTNTNGAKRTARPDRAVIPELTQKVREKTHREVEMCS